MDHHTKNVSDNVFGDCKIGKQIYPSSVHFGAGVVQWYISREFSGIFWKRANNVFIYRRRWNREWISWAAIFVVVLVASEPATRISATMQCFLYLMNVRNLIWVSMRAMSKKLSKLWMLSCLHEHTQLPNKNVKGSVICSLDEFSYWN